MLRQEKNELLCYFIYRNALNAISKCLNEASPDYPANGMTLIK